MAKKTEGEVIVENEVVPPIEEGKSIQEQSEPTVKLSEFNKLVAMIEKMQEEGKPKKIKKVTEHTAHIWRMDGKWVVDFKDRNDDEYKKGKVHAFKKWNELTREWQTNIELVFQDGSTKEIPLTTYLEHRLPIYCQIIKRHLADKSYSIGEVEKKKEVNDKLVGTGVMIEQEVAMVEETFELKTPDGSILMLPWYVLA